MRLFDRLVQLLEMLGCGRREHHRGVGLATAYNHLSSYSTHVGENVSRGEVIGYVGSTGYSTGCHLHFMVFENGATVNPMGWL